MPYGKYQPAVRAAQYTEMACHVWALSGNPLTIAIINAKYDQIGSYLMGQANPTDTRMQQRVQAVLSELGDDQRVATLALLRDEFGMAPGNGTDIRIWGLFRNHLQMLPEHMWITVGNRIYDTMPSAPIRRDDTANGRNPPSEAHELQANVVFSVEVSALHTEQSQVINSPNWA
jgi:hypothetical protein